MDGKPRLDGTRSFLESRGINLPEGSPDDKPGTPTIQGLSNEKNDLVVEKIRTDGVKVYDDTIRYIKAVRAGLAHRDRLVQRQHRGRAQLGRDQRPFRHAGGRLRWPRSGT